MTGKSSPSYEKRESTFFIELFFLVQLTQSCFATFLHKAILWDALDSFLLPLRYCALAGSCKRHCAITNRRKVHWFHVQRLCEIPHQPQLDICSARLDIHNRALPHAGESSKLSGRQLCHFSQSAYFCAKSLRDHFVAFGYGLLTKRGQVKFKVDR